MENKEVGGEKVEYWKIHRSAKYFQVSPNGFMTQSKWHQVLFVNVRVLFCNKFVAYKLYLRKGT